MRVGVIDDHLIELVGFVQLKRIACHEIDGGIVGEIFACVLDHLFGKINAQNGTGAGLKIVRNHNARAAAQVKNTITRLDAHKRNHGALHTAFPHMA